MSTVINNLLKKYDEMPGVVGIIVLNNEGIAIKSTVDNETTIQYSAMIFPLTDKARCVVKDINPLKADELKHLRLRTRKHELVISLDKDFIVIVIQEPVA